MKKIEINTLCCIKIFNKDLQIDAYLAQPINNGAFGAVIVFQEIFGVNENIREITKLIAQQRYIVIAQNIINFYLIFAFYCLKLIVLIVIMAL